mmetsp:Transcript_5322/g.8354  ORF Transcript_5322/g.8354 Transcript_5322/m.8354 type:complete len:257 (-) Transcript_5322:36-806(-)|eukprot:CAMPEP_0175091684 /NCGR_PEP_ID=MMETSP0086_2-20121207/2039_1 /TAXON_ID=136419 /ORGANISM="Unknown Unknown, Strain D1" /LENGTH=256 /DNA_ID=CAMNT_0016364453 /DNA_START=27 /DNA_END=797 /DNA_ORIENTATION=+
MSASGSGYDQSVTTFSPTGRVFQVEYAQKAVEKTGLTIGIRCNDGVVLGSQRPITSKMLVKSNWRRVITIDQHSGMATAGLQPDARALGNKAREEARSYREFYGSNIPGNVLAERMAGEVHMHTLYWYLRPFGAAILLANYDNSGPNLSMIQPSGEMYRYFGSAIGQNTQGAKTELEKIDFKTITCVEAAKEIARIIYKLYDDTKEKPFELEMSWVCDASGKKHVRVPEDIRQEAITLAKAAKEAAEMESSDDEED